MSKKSTTFYGKKCEICDREYGKGLGKVNLVEHHMSYEPEILCYLCYSCHWWWHGTRQIYNHPFIKKYGKDGGSAMFHEKACELAKKYLGGRKGIRND